jgi:hypothetical protein
VRRKLHIQSSPAQSLFGKNNKQFKTFDADSFYITAKIQDKELYMDSADKREEVKKRKEIAHISKVWSHFIKITVSHFNVCKCNPHKNRDQIKAIYNYLKVIMLQ